MLIGIEGGLGCGKTLAMTYLGYLAKTKYHSKVSSNYFTKFADTFIDSEQSFNEFRSGMMLLDEIWLWSDSRKSSSKRNEIVNKIPLTSRKRRLIIVYTSQQLGQVDLRIRNITDIFVRVKLKIIKDTKGNPLLDQKGRPLKICIMRFRKCPLRKIVFLANTMYDLYDTEEEVNSLDISKGVDKHETRTKKKTAN
jgi:hypothetical protein